MISFSYIKVHKNDFTIALFIIDIHIKPDLNKSPSSLPTTCKRNDSGPLCWGVGTTVFGYVYCGIGKWNVPLMIWQVSKVDRYQLDVGGFILISEFSCHLRQRCDHPLRAKGELDQQ